MTSQSSTAPSSGDTLVEFADNGLLPQLFGSGDRHLAQIEAALGVHIVPRGNIVAVAGPATKVAQAASILRVLHDRLERGVELGPSDVDAAIRVADFAPLPRQPQPGGADLDAIRTRKRQIVGRTPGQSGYIRALKTASLTFGLGPAGTGKTYLAVATAVDMLMTGKVSRIILSRPAVEAGERLGFLPGDLKEKVDPYLRPIYDALHDMLPHEQVLKRLASGDIEVAPLAFMRGRTLANAFVILDEAQNTTPVQMKMFLTRLGEDSAMAITGDLSQIDLPSGTVSGLSDALDTLSGVEGIAVVRLTEIDVVRHPLVRRIVGAYEARDRERSAGRAALRAPGTA